MKITAVNRIQSGISSKCRCCIATGLVLLLGSAVTLAATQQPAPGQQAPLADDRNQPATAAISELVERPRIQLAVLLDTSNSMDGLIEQTRNQLWQVINEFADARQNGMTPILEIALFDYGNSGNAQAAGYVRQLSGFTRELDAVSESLFALTTRGGEEFCGYAIETAIHDLQWSQSDRDIRIIFIAGNESFTQGPVPYQQALALAQRQGISITTIHAGDHDSGVADGWQAAALLAGGEYLSIDTDQAVKHVNAPQDARIAELNAALNQTYLPYGSKGAGKAERQLEQDRASSEISFGLLAKRAVSKASEFYGNADWDLVDAYRDGELDAEELVEMEDAALPNEMQGMSAQQKLDFLGKKQVERQAIQAEIRELHESRSAYVAEHMRTQAAASPAVGDALGAAMRKQAGEKNFTFDH